MSIAQVAQTSHQGLVHHPETIDAVMDFQLKAQTVAQEA